jgi:hypothetical protein
MNSENIVLFHSFFCGYVVSLTVAFFFCFEFFRLMVSYSLVVLFGFLVAVLLNKVGDWLFEKLF